MDFIVGLPKTKKGNDTIWVIVDRLTKYAHFLPRKITNSMDTLAKMYLREIVQLHGLLMSITHRDTRFTSKFSKQLQEVLGTKLNFSMAFHPQIDRPSERVIQILEDMLRACALDWKGS